MRLVLVRHGETESNRTALALGRADVPLNETGLRQAGQLAAALAGEPIAAVYSSPLGRALTTAGPIAEHHALQVREEPGLIEMEIGELEGLPFAVVREKYPGFIEHWMSDAGPQERMPGGERLVDVAERAWQTVESLRERHADETVAAVTHNFVLLSLLARALGMRLSEFRKLRHTVGAISIVELGAGRVVVERLNDTCHLACE
jgi:2,3-bisphosphoglycerate-dependent phosphoglycerate mutase